MIETAARNSQTATAFLVHCFVGRMEEAIAMFTPDFVWQVMGPAGGLRVSGRHSRDRAERMLRGMYKVLPHGMRHTIVGVTAQDDRVAIEAEAEGEWVDGRLYRNAYHFLFRVREGQIAEVKEYADTLSVFGMEHPGLIP